MRQWAQLRRTQVQRSPVIEQAVRPVVESLEPRRLLSVSAVDDHISTAAGTPVTVSGSDLLSNDSGGNVIQSVTQPAHGVVTRNDDGSVTYTPNPGFSGHDQFTYTAGDTAPELSIDAPAASANAASGFAAAAALQPLYNAGNIVVSSYQFGMTRNDLGKVVYAPLQITAANSIASPGFLSALANGIAVGSITLTTKDSLGRNALAFTFQNVRFTDYSNVSDGGENLGSVQFFYDSLSISYTAYNADGTSRPAIQASIDRTQNTITTSPFVAGSDLTHSATPPPEILSFGAGKDVQVSGADFSYKSNAGDPNLGAGGLLFNYNPFIIQSAPSLESVPLISFLLSGVTFPTASYTARNPDTGVTARLDVQTSEVSSYSISGDSIGAAVETYNLRPVAVTESFGQPSVTSHSATWNSAARTGTTTVDLGTSSVASPTQAGDLLALDPFDPNAAGGIVNVNRYSMGFDNELAQPGKQTFQQMEFETDFGPQSPGLLTSVATGASFRTLTLTHRDAKETVTSTLTAGLGEISTVHEVSDGTGHISETVDAIYGNLHSSIAREETTPVGPPFYYTGSWDTKTGTGTGDFVDTSAPAAQTTAAKSLAAAATPPSDTLDIEPALGHGVTDAVLNNINGSWTADQRQWQRRTHRRQRRGCAQRRERRRPPHRRLQFVRSLQHGQRRRAAPPPRRVDRQRVRHAGQSPARPDARRHVRLPHVGGGPEHLLRYVGG